MLCYGFLNKWNPLAVLRFPAQMSPLAPCGSGSSQSMLSIFVSIHPLLDYLSHLQQLLLPLHAILSPSLVLLSLSLQPLLFRWQKIEPATPVTLLTTMP
jgi:hypothetical protein